MKKFASRRWKLLTLLLVLAVPLVIYSQRYVLYDAWRLRDYTASVAVSNLADQDTMTTPARHIFYVNHPTLVDDVKTFRQDCTVAEQTIVLGCYQGGENGIFVFNVQDSRLAGVQQVTAAHEMLHAAYERLNAADRDYVDGLLEDYYQHDLHDQRIMDTINSYKKTEPNDLVNEMHSIFGTEIVGLPTPLENYYKRYFTNRTAVTDFSANYDNEFTSRESQAKVLEAQLNGLSSKIDNEQTSLKTQYDSISAQRTQLENMRNSGQTDAYNAAVDSFNTQVDDYNSKVGVYQVDVAKYNKILSQYNQIAGDLRSLYSSIDTSVSKTSGQ